MSLDPRAVPPAPAENDVCNAAYESSETLALLAKRRSTKIAHLGGPGPDAAQLDALLRLAARVPDHGKLGPWRFVVIEGDGRNRAGDAIANVIANDAGVDEMRLNFARGLFLRAPVCVMIVSSTVQSQKIPEWEQIQSASAACFALLLAAHAMGFAGAWLTEWVAYDPRTRVALGLSEHEQIAGLVYLGTAKEPATERVRADISSRVTRF